MTSERESGKKPSERPRKESERACFLCCGETEIVAVAECDHPVCWKCSTRMRVLCQQNYCAVCRKDLDKVVFTTKRQTFSSISTEHLRLERKHGIYFADNVTQKRYRELLEHMCKECPEKPTFRTFPQLSKHMRKEHELFYCDLCSEHLQIFSWERKTYSRKELAEHRRIGDKNDKSYRGHPLCEFCDERYVDNDSLLRHLRTDHYYCHVCDTNGSNQYYSDYDVLRNHFRDAHFLCEEDECREEKFTSVFSTNIDLKAHQAAVHLKKLSKAQARQARQLDMNFQLVPRQSGYTGRGRGTVSREDYDDVNSNQHPGRRNRRGQGQAQERDDKREQADQREKAMLAAAMKASLQYESANREEEKKEELSAAPAVKPDDFPSLGEAGTNQGSLFDNSEDFPSLKAVASSLTSQQTNQTTQQSMAMRVGHNFKRSVKNGTLNEEDFPQLGANQKKANPVAPPTGRWMGSEPTPAVSATQRLAQDFPPLQTLKKRSNPVRAALPERRPPSGNNVTQNKSKTAPKQVPSQEEDYPALAANYVPWSKVQVVPTQDKENVNRRTVSQAPPTQDDFPALAPAKPKATPQWTKKQAQTKTQGGSKWSSLAAEESVSKKKSSVQVKEQKAEEKVSEGTAKKKKKKRKKNKGGGSGEEDEKGKMESMNEVTNDLKEAIGPTTTLVSEYGDSRNNTAESAKPTTLLSEDNTQRGDGNNTQGGEGEEVDAPSFSDMPSFSDVDFPSLGSDISSAYFSTTLPKEEISAVYRDLGKTPSQGAGPPPGLSQLADSLIQVQVPASSVTKAPPGFQPHTSPEPLAPSPLPLPPVDPGPYIQPDDFQQRNHQLMSSIMECLKGNDKIGQFKDFSRKFRQGALPASEYYTICCKLFQKSFSAIFVELLVLLPDAHKQQELWQTVTASGRQGSCDISSQCLSCPTCLQIVKNGDFSTHTQKHSLEDDFPALSSVLPPPGLIQDFPSLGEPFGTKKTSAWKKM
ncbi:E3 ubiquitin-protein ligase ZNF598-like [Branchiostoma lanceolatum]|uniref:E3 ubiquitin-protein ligase ZNF598-like n=1 Tax=Branchiostoma lanceolatum TaxID=7740 RepID=UPI0034527878